VSTPMRSRRAWSGIAVLLTTLVAGAARAQSPAVRDTTVQRVPEHADTADTSVGGFLRTLSDSTSRYFGRSAAPPDTAGLDTLTGIVMVPEIHRVTFGGYPRFNFNRVDGATPGLNLKVEAPRPWGGLTARGAWAAGSRTWLGSLTYENSFFSPPLRGVHVRAWGGRATVGMNRERSEGFLTGLRGLLNGADYTHYLRHDGVEAQIEREVPAWRIGVGYRDQLESPLVTTTDWNLLHKDLVVPGNLPAIGGRARELQLTAGARLPVVPARAEIAWQSSGPALHSAFRYDRVRVAAGADISLGTVASLVPQVMYGRVTGDPPPQATFYLGGGNTLRSVHSDQRGGTGVSVGRVDLIGAKDLLAVLHVKHSSTLLITPAVFAAIGAAWGDDPYGGPPRSGKDWPERREWLSEAGAALHYDLGAFGTRLAVGYVWALGPRDGREDGLLVEVTHPLGLLRPPREE